MAQSYTRQSSFADGDTITAALFNNEYNQLVNAFSYSSTNEATTGHRHDGSSGEGGNIPQIGDLDFLNKIVVDSTNNRWGFYVEVSSVAVEQLRLQDGALIPVTDSDVDLGTSSLYFKDAYIDSVTTTGNVSIGGNLTVTGNATISGNLTFGDADTDSINLAAEIDSHIVPNTDDTYDLGTSTKQWRNLYIDGTAEIDTLAINGTTVTSTAAELNILDGVTSTAAELNILDGVTSTTAELNILDGVTATATEINLLDGVTSTTAELNILDGVTATAAEINTLDGITSTVAELNILDGVTASATDINLIDGITNGTVIASKAIVTDANKDISGGRNITITGELDAATLDISGNADIDGTLETDALSINGTTVTSTAAELNILDGVTSTAAELNILDGVTSTTAELNILDGVTATAAELNILDGVTSTAAELNILDGKAFLDEDDMSSNSATGIASQQSIKAYVDTTVAATNEVVEDSTPQLGGDLDLNSNDITGTGNINITGTIQSSGNITGTLATAAQPNITSLGTLTGLTTTGNLVIGTEDNNAAILEINGNATGSAEGGEIRLDTAADYDGTYEFYRLDVSEDDFRIGRQGQTDFTIFSNGTAQFFGNLAATLSTAAQPNITSVGTLTTLTVDDITINGSTISDAGDLTLDVGGNIELDADGGDIKFQDDGVEILRYSSSTDGPQFFSAVPDKDIIFKGNDGGSTITALTLDMSNAGAATFNSSVDAGAINASGTIKQETTVGGFITLKRNDTTLTNNADVGAINFETTDTDDAGVAATILGSGDGTAGGMKLRFYSGTASSKVERQTIYSNGNVVFNENSADADFRVESNGNTHALFVDGGTSRVGINKSAPDRALHVNADSASDIATFQNDSGSYTFGKTAGLGSLDLASDANFRIRHGSTESVRFGPSATVFNELSADVDFRVESNNKDHMFFVDGGNDRIGMNISSPTHTLHIKNEVSSDTIDENNGLVKMQSSGGNGMIFGTIASSPFSSYIQSAYVTDTSLAQYNLALNPIGGNVGIGLSSGIDEKLHIKDGDLKIEHDTHPRIHLEDVGNSTSEIGVSGRGAGTDGIYIAGYAAIAANTYDFKITGGDGSIQTRSTIYPATGIQLGSSAASNNLDDYEEGTWTPVLTRVSAPNITFNVEEANYTKIGRMVTVQMGLLITGVTSQGSSVTFVDGLPFNNGGVAYSSTGSVGMNSGFASECHVCQIGGNSDNTINFHADDISFANLQTDFTNGGRIYCSLTYEAS